MGQRLRNLSMGGSYIPEAGAAAAGAGASSSAAAFLPPPSSVQSVLSQQQGSSLQSAVERGGAIEQHLAEIQARRVAAEAGRRGEAEAGLQEAGLGVVHRLKER